MYFRVNEFEVGVNDSIFSGNAQQNIYNIIIYIYEIIERNRVPSFSFMC